MRHETSFELTLLGRAALRLRRGNDAEAIHLPTRKALALLAYLALNGRTSRAELSGLLWGDSTDAAARKNLRQEIYRLQTMTISPWLEVDRYWLGLRGRFSVDARQLREAAALGDLRRVTALYRGELLEGLSLPGATEFEGWLEVEREALSRLYIEALGAQAGEQERRGAPREAIETWQRLLRHDPLQESVRRELMRLHWQIGERSRALEQFSELQRLLHEELRLEPAPETLRLVEQIRNAPPAAPLESGRLPSELPFTGREAALSWLEAQSGLALICGEPGIGKTRLAVEFVRQSTAAVPGARTLTLRGAAPSSHTPLYPITSALLEHFERHPQSFDALRPAWQHEIERLLPGHDGQTRAAPSAEGRGWFLEALAQSLAALVGVGGCLLLEEVQHFDADSLEVITHLLRRAPDLRLIATLRPDEYPDTPAARALEPLLDSGLASRYVLQPLTQADVVRLLAALSGPNLEPMLPCVHGAFESTGGNPLFLLEGLRAALDTGALGFDATGWLIECGGRSPIEVVSSVRDSINRRLERMGGGLKRLLEAASLAAEPFNLEALSAATGLEPWAALGALESALELQLLEPAAPGYRFAQAVTRNALRAALSDERRALLQFGLTRAPDPGASSEPRPSVWALAQRSEAAD